MRTVAHIDGDELAYYWAYVSESEEALEEGIQQRILELAAAVDADDFKLYLSCSRSKGYRRRIFPGYKAHRDSREAPVLLKHALAYIKLTYNAELHPRLEADDLLGLAITKDDGNINISVTQDKDAATVPGYWYNPRKQEMRRVTPEEALHSLMIQVLAGDSADGYKGCPGIGPVKAKKILGDTTEGGWDRVKAQYTKSGLTPQDFKINYLMAKILRRNTHGKQKD